MRFILTGVSVLALAGTAFADTLRVPRDFETITEAAAAANDGDTIVVSKGVYLENVTFNQANLTIVGKRAIVDGRIGDDGEPCFTVNGSGSTVQGFTFRYDSTQLRVNGSNCTVKKCRFLSARGTALDAAGASFTTVSDCVVDGSAEYGIVIGSGSVTKCSVRRAGAGGIVTSGADSVVERCTVQLTSNGYAIRVTVEGATISGNRVAGCRNGIRAIGANMTVQGNTLSHLLDLPAIWVTGNDALVSGNSIVDARGGIEVSGDSANVLFNRISGFGDQYLGIWVVGDAVTVAGNQVRDGLGETIGIQVESASPTGGGFVEDNRVSDVDGTGILVHGTGIAVRRNRAAACGNIDWGYGFFISGTGNTVEDSTSVANRNVGFSVDGTGHVLRRCRAENNSAFGFVVFGDGHTVDDSVATNHSGDGIVNLGTDLTLSNSTFLNNGLDVAINPFGPATFTAWSTNNTFDSGGFDTPSQTYQFND
jgi:hypothetical protein